MFGYIAPQWSLLSEPQRRRYQTYYCGMCRSLGERTGSYGRLLLSHDMTFLSILLSSLTDMEERTEQIRCELHPLRRREIFQNRMIEYAAAMNLILMDFKCQDQVIDDHSGLGRMERRLLKPSVEIVRKDYPSQYRRIEENLSALWEEEKRGLPDPDKLCNLSGEMLAAAFVPSEADSFLAGALHGLGAGLGRFIYWMDAWDDLKKDQRKGRFNPLYRWTGRENMDSLVRDILEMLLGEAVGYFELLPLEKDLDLLRNVLYSGVWQRFDVRQTHGGRRRKA